MKSGMVAPATSSSTMVMEAATSAGLAVQTALSADLPLLFADKRSVRQILLNLLSNAVKFTPEGGTVTIEACLEPSGTLSLVVRDTGIGMSSNDIDVVLKPFGQIESSHTRSHDGTGLGLPITRSLAEVHGGSLTIESEVGRGTAIIVRFPPERVIDGAVDRQQYDCTDDSARRSA